MKRLALVVVLLVSPAAHAGDWPQWRGPDRSNVSAETGLLTRWPEGGPKLLWTATGLGQSVVSVAIAGGRAFTVGYRGDDEFVVCVDVKDGKKLWETRIGPAARELQMMRGLSQRVPTVDSERVYVTSFGAELFCLDSATGKEQWHKNYDTNLAGKRAAFWFCDQPLVDGDLLIVTPGGAEAAIAALDKKSGAVIWTAQNPDGDTRAYSTLIVAEIAGVRQYINFLSPGVVSVAAADGKLLWRFADIQARITMTSPPLVRADELFVCHTAGAGSAMLKISQDGGRFKVEEKYRTRKTLNGWMNTPTRLDDHLYLVTGQGLTCLEWATGKEVWTGRLGQGMRPFTIADGHIYLRDVNGKMYLAEASPVEFR